MFGRFGARRAMVAVSVLAVVGTAAAQGVTEKEIVIGRTAGFSGELAGPVKDGTLGAMLYIDWVNSRGGVFGRKIVIDSRDDGFDPRRAGENARRLIEEKHVLAIFFNCGTAQSEAILPLAVKHGVPLIAPSTGAALLHDPVNPLVFNVRSKYQTEAERAIEQLAAMGIRRIALVHTDDPFGKDGAWGAKRGFDKSQLQPATVVTHDRNKSKIEDTGIQAVLRADPQAVLVISSPAALADFVHSIRHAGSAAQVITLSNMSSGSLVKNLGEHARGVMITQVFPNPVVARTGLAREFQKLARTHPDVPLSYAAMEGFGAAKVLVEGLKRAGPQLTRKRLISALESMRELDLGDMTIGYGPNDRTGSNYVGLSIIDQHGQFME